MTVTAMIGKEKKCPVCHKVFIFRNGWVYKRGQGDHVKVFCSWGCLRKWEAAHQTDKDKRELIVRELMRGKTIKEVADKFSVDSRKVWYYSNKLKKGWRLDEHEAKPSGSK